MFGQLPFDPQVISLGGLDITLIDLVAQEGSNLISNLVPRAQLRPGGESGDGLAG